MTKKLVLPYVFPSLNTLFDSAKIHWARYYKLKKKLTKDVANSAKEQGFTLSGFPSDFIFTWYCKTKRRDPDNIASGAKIVFDGLVEAGIIENDGWNYVGDLTHRFRIDDYQRVEVSAIPRQLTINY